MADRSVPYSTIVNKLVEYVRDAKAKGIVRKRQSNNKIVRWYGDTAKQAKLENIQKENELRKLNGSMERYYRELRNIIETLQCDGGINRRSLIKGLENEAVHLHNVEAFMSVLEQRLKQIVSFVYFVEMRKSDYELPSSKIVQGVDVVNYRLNEFEYEPIIYECAECAMDAECSVQEIQVPLDMASVREGLLKKALTPELAYRMHNLSQCGLPASRSLFAKSLQ